ncbi:MAG: helix-turn-helix transcriptional regulator [Clostridia bacterium]|nr:helix-turn-helix transcriptional regulator [Clostridia bacterium]
MVTDTSEHLLQPGDVCYNPAMSYYGVHILGETPYERVVMHITPNENFDKLAKEFFGESGIINVNVRKHLLPWIERYKEYSKILPMKIFPPLAEALVRELLYICFMEKNSTTQAVDTAENILKNALGYIDSNWSTIKNIREISNALFISPSYMYEIFNKKLNMAPKTYLMQKRLQAAHAYLISGIQPNEVSQLVGFNTYTAFYRACKAFYGKTPQEIWVKKNVQEKE